MPDGDETDQESADLEPRAEEVEPSHSTADHPHDQQGGVFAAEYKSHSGPLPSQDWLTAVEALCPGATEMVLRDFTDEREHQRQIQLKAMDLDAVVIKDFTRYQMTRLLIAGVLALFLAAAGIALILLGKGVYGFVLLIAEITGLVWAFLAGRGSEAEDEDLDADELLAELENGEGNV